MTPMRSPSLTMSIVLSLTIVFSLPSTLASSLPSTQGLFLKQTIIDETNRSSVKTRQSPDSSGKLTKFAKDISAFSICSIMNHDSLCRKCADEITRVTASYVDLMGSSDRPHPVSTTDSISDPHLSFKTMDTIKDYYSHAKSLWQYGNCDNCYEGKSKKFRHDVVEFFDNEYKFENCLEDISQNDTCTRCRPHYSLMNKYYEDMVYDYSGNLCLDIRESMAAARGKWTSLGCVVTVGFDIIVVSIASVVILTSLTLYLLSRRFTYVDRPGVVVQKRLASQLSSVTLNSADTVGETTYLLSHQFPQGRATSSTSQSAPDILPPPSSTHYPSTRRLPV